MIEMICNYVDIKTAICGDVVAFVHAKGTSSRVPNKNMRLLGGIPLFCHAIKNARESKLVDVVVIDSDNDEILKIGEEFGALPIKRPNVLATNLATGDDLAYWQASNAPKSKIVLQVIPTAPFLKPKTIDTAISMLLDEPKIDSVAGVYEESLYTWENGRPSYYNPDGSIPNSFDLKKVFMKLRGFM